MLTETEPDFKYDLGITILLALFIMIWRTKLLWSLWSVLWVVVGFIILVGACEKPLTLWTLCYQFSFEIEISCHLNNYIYYCLKINGKKGPLRSFYLEFLEKTTLHSLNLLRVGSSVILSTLTRAHIQFKQKKPLAHGRDSNLRPIESQSTLGNTAF